MTTTAELLKTFEDLAVNMRTNAAQVQALATSQGMLGQMQVTINSLLEQAALADAAAAALRNGDAVSIDEL